MRASNTVSACRVTTRFQSVMQSIAIQTSSGSAVRTNSMRLTRRMVTRSLVFHVVGMPSYQNQRLRKTMHHTLGDGIFDKFIDISAQAACSHAVINPDNCVIEMERVIAEARRNSQPAYIVVPSDYAQAPVTPTEVWPLTLKSNEASLKKAVAAITERIKNAKSIVALPAFTLSRVGLQKEAREAIEALGCPFATTSMEKSIVDESHPQFAGMYAECCPLTTRGRSS